MTTSRFPLGSRARQRAALLLEALAGADPYMVARARAELDSMRHAGGPAEARRLGLELALTRARDGKDPLKGHEIPSDTCGMVEGPPRSKEHPMTTHPKGCDCAACDEARREALAATTAQQRADKAAKALEIPDDPFADLPGNLGAGR